MINWAAHGNKFWNVWIYWMFFKNNLHFNSPVLIDNRLQSLWIDENTAFGHAGHVGDSPHNTRSSDRMRWLWCVLSTDASVAWRRSYGFRLNRLRLSLVPVRETIVKFWLMWMRYKWRYEPAAWWRYTPCLLTVARVLFRVDSRTSTLSWIHRIAASQSGLRLWSIPAEAMTFASLTRSAVVTCVHRLKRKHYQLQGLCDKFKFEKRTVDWTLSKRLFCAFWAPLLQPNLLYWSGAPEFELDQLCQNCSIESCSMSLKIRRLARSYSCSRSSKLFAFRSSIERSGQPSNPWRYSSKLCASRFKILFRDRGSSVKVSLSRLLKRICETKRNSNGCFYWRQKKIDSLLEYVWFSLCQQWRIAMHHRHCVPCQTKRRLGGLASDYTMTL